jgi:putative glutamine amidotransferase
MTMAKVPRPFIGINADYVAAGKQAHAHVRLPAGYFDSIVTAGGLPIVLPPLARDVDVDDYLDRLDGVVLAGGADVVPARNGLPPHPAAQPMAARRDDSDRVLIRRLFERQLPVLAIGVGLQQLNLACGGALHQHLPEDLPRSLPHLDRSGQAHRHLIRFEAESRLEEIYGGSEAMVNSSHHMAVRTAGAGLRVAARSPDGVIEALEWEAHDWFCVGVQWHPESETASALDMQLFEAFIQACLRVAQPLRLSA